MCIRDRFLVDPFQAVSSPNPPPVLSRKRFVVPKIKSEAINRVWCCLLYTSGCAVRVHLKVDTGMSRLGVPLERVPEALAAIAGRSELRLEGAFSHLATADEADETYARQQLARWTDVCRLLPVSYTHLDVYKRQELNEASSM